MKAFVVAVLLLLSASVSAGETYLDANTTVCGHTLDVWDLMEALKNNDTRGIDYLFENGACKTTTKAFPVSILTENKRSVLDRDSQYDVVRLYLDNGGTYEGYIPRHYGTRSIDPYSTK